MVHSQRFRQTDGNIKPVLVRAHKVNEQGISYNITSDQRTHFQKMNNEYVNV